MLNRKSRRAPSAQAPNAAAPAAAISIKLSISKRRSFKFLMASRTVNVPPNTYEMMYMAKGTTPGTVVHQRSIVAPIPSSAPHAKAKYISAEIDGIFRIDLIFMFEPLP
ncbi:hypothetical protein G6F65_021322 [Rhizopus arrhizus]|nr:hypothetical protein G6F65_021322 [Rhizopus arrhizus]